MNSRVAFEAGSAAASIMSTTMTPFLYYTKTLSGLTLVGPKTAFRFSHTETVARPKLRSLAHQCICKRQYVSQGYNGSRTNRSNNSRRNEVALDEVPFEFDRISKSTKSRERPASNSWENVRVNEYGEVEDGGIGDLGMHNLEGEDGAMYGNEGEGDATSINFRSGPRESTITEAEKRAFQKIFSDMFGQGSPHSTHRPTEEPKESAETKLDKILNTAINKLPKSRGEAEKIVKSYPPALRGAAARALRLGQEYDDDPFDGDMEELAEVDHDELEVLRDPERERVETLMKEAKSDFELWEIMEKEVFSLVPKLGLDKNARDPEKEESKDEDVLNAKAKPKRGRATAKMRKAKNKAAEEAEKPELFNNIVAQTPKGAPVSALTFYGPLYPSYLLLGLRLLDRSFARPSPLSLSVLPRIKSLGTISHVLGASTQLYNELISIYLYRYEDFANITKMLQEMEQSAVELNEETLDIVISILVMKAAIGRGQKGKVIKELWNMPQYSPVNLHYWRDKITGTLKIKSQLGGERVLLS